jgi:type II secretory pathway pseudopilin PulG
MVVIAIIGILIASAAPAYAAARASAQERAAQANIRTGLIAANTTFISTPDQSFDTITSAVLSAAEPSLRWTVGQQTTGPGTIASLTGCVSTNPGVCSPGDPWGLGLAVDAGDGTCWYAFQADNDAPWYGAGYIAGGVCDAANAASVASGRTL